MVDFKLDLNTPVVPVQAAGADPKPSYGVDLNSPVNVPADLEEQAKQPQYSVFGTPLPGSLAERTGRPQHPLSKAVSQNFDLTDGIKGDDLAINEAIADTFGFNYVEEDAGDGTIRKVKKYNSVTPEMVGTMNPGVRESMKQRQDVKKTMEAVSITRSRLAKDAESVAILRGEINMLYAAEGAMNTFKRIKNGYEFDAMSEALGAAPEKLGMILGLVSAGARGGKNRDSAFAVAEGLAALASGGTEEDMQKAAVFFKQAWDYAKRAEGMPRSGAADEFLRAFATIDNVGTPEGFLKAAKIFATNLYGAASTIQEIVAEQAGPLIAQIGARLIAGPAGGAIVSAGTNYAQEQFGFTPEARDNIKKKFGYDLTTEKGISSFVRDTKAVDAFIEFGAKRGVIIAALDLVGLGVLRAFSRTNLNRLSKIAVGTFSEATTSFTGESLASIWSGQGFKLSDSLLESMAGAHPVSVGIEAYTAGAADYRDFTHSKQAKEWLKSGEATRDTIAGLPAEKLARASDVLADKLKSDGIDTVYIKADELLKFDQDGSAADTLGLTSEAVQSAAAEGQDVAIDAATYIRHILGKDGFDALMRHTRFDIAGMTAEEADNYTALGIGDQIEQALQDKALARIAPSIDKTQLAKLNEDLDLIKSTVSDMLAATGQYEGRKADLFAQLTAQRYASRAIRMTEETGKPIDALALFDADNLRIQGSDTRTGLARSPEFARFLEQQAFNQEFVGTGTVKVTPAEQAFFDEVLGNEVNRAELLEAVPSLAVKDGSLSVAAEDIDAFLSAMNDFVISDGAISVPPRLRALTSSRDIVSKMEFNQTAKEFNVTPEQLKAELEAAGGDITQTPLFKAWFGDSKVVDADGKPLFVYHGTTSNIDTFSTPSFFAENNSEASGYSFWVDVRRADRMRDKYTLVSDPSLDGKRLPYIGIISDIPYAERENWWATDEGIVRFKDKDKNKVEFASNVVASDGTYDASQSTIVVETGDGAADYNSKVADVTEYIDSNKMDQGSGGNVLPVYLSIKNPLILSPLDANRLGARLGVMTKEEVSAQVEEWKAQGYDGIQTTSDEAVFYPELFDGETIAQWVAFEPTQIKSIFNRGTFDPNDNRILYQDAPSADDIAARLDDRAPPKIPSGATYMGVGEQYTVENTNADAPRRRANSSLIQTSTNAGNAAAQTAALDALFERHPEPLSSEQAWVDLANDAFSLDRVPMPPWRTLELVQQGSSAIASEISGLNEGMKRNAEEGLKTAREFGELYANGEATPDITAKAFLWSFLSRGVSPYVQEGAFLDAIGSPILTDLMQRAAREGWSTELDEAYSAWAADAIPPGSPGRGTQHNLNAFGRQFLRTMTQLSPGTNQTGLEIIHGMIADGTPSKDIRREFLRVGAGAGIDNKVVSFTLLLLGRTDVLVLDRVQVRNQFNDGRFDGENIYDTEVNADGKQVTGTAFAEMTFGHKGLLYYEAMEAALQPIVEQAYDSLGMEGSLGRYHWDSWLLASNQEVGHASVEGLLRDAQGKAAPYAGAFVRQGKYNNYDYGFRYGTVNDGSPVVLVEKLDLSGQAVIVPHALMADSKSDMRKAINKLKTTAKKRGDQYGVTIPWTAALTEEERGEYDAAVQRAGTLAPDVWAYDANAVGRENATGTIDPEEGVQEGQAQKEVGDVAPTPVGTPTSFAEDQMFQGEAKAPRGGFAPSDLINDQDGNPVNLIEIFEKADPSTFLHESGHFWLEMLKADAQSVGGQFQKDWSIVNDWWGLRSLEIKDEAIRRAKKKKDKAALAVLEKMTDAQVKAYIRKGDLRGFSDPAARFLSVSMHEQFARGTEEYFRTARAPSIGLASLFNSFRVWIGSVYRGMLGMDVSFSPEVREVLDRMIASDEEIEAANGQFEMAALFDDASQAGMSKEEFSNYHKGVEEGRNQSKANQLAKHMRQMRTEKTVLWEEQREAMRPEVTSEIANQRAFKLVFGITQGGLADGSTLQDGERIPRINGTVLKALMEEEGLSLKDLPRVGGKAIYSMSTKEGETSDPGAAAAAYGYDDVITMIAELTELNSFPDAVNVAIDERMKKEHGSIDDTGDQEAIASIHGDHIAKVMAAELQALRTSEPAFKPAFIRQYAADKISNMKTGEIKHHLFTAAERRHAKLAKQAIKSGDKATAYKHQFQRLVNHRLAEASLKARSDIDKKQTYLKKFGNKKKKFESVAPGYISTIRTIIEATDFRTPISERARLKAELQAINAFVEKAKNNDGAVLEMPAWLVERDALTNVRDMTYQEFLEMHESVSLLERQGKLAKKIRSGMEYRDRQEVIGEMIETLSGRDVTRVNKINDQWADKPEGMSAIYASGLELLAVADAQLLKVEFLLEALDGKPLGPWHQALYQPFAAAAVARNELSATASKLIADGFKSLPKAIRQNMGRRVDVGGLGTPGMKMTRGQLIMLALNTGNESNLDKVIRGFGGDKKSNVRGAGWNINEDLISKALDQLSAEEWKFIQSIWDHAEILWPDVARIYEAENGVAPERVEPRVIKTKHGDFSGGYFPLQYDHRRPYDASSSRMEQKNALEMMQSSVGRASVNSSMTKGRTGYAAPIKLDIEDLARTFDNSIHFITHYDAVRNAKKIITDPDLRFELENVVGKEYAKELDNWVAALANNNQPASPANFVERTGNWLMKNTTMAVLGASYTTLAAQSLGLTVGLDALVADQKTYGPIEITVAAADLAYGLSLSLSPAHYKSVMQASPFMRFRRENYDREVKQVLKASKGRIVGSLTTIKERTITEWGMQAIAEAQFFSVDLPVWTASYNRALRADPGDERGAIAYADRTVRRSQSSGDLIDLSAVQRQGKLTKLFTMFYTFFSALYAILRGVGGDLMKNASTSPASAISRAATRAFVLLTLQAVGTGLIRGELPDLEPEDEDAEGLLGYLAKETVLSALGTVPFVRDLSTGALKGYGYSMSPAGIFGDAFVKSVAAVDKLTTEGFIEDAEYTALVRQLKPLILLGGTLTGIPSVQINRSLDGAAAYFDESYGWHWSDSIRGYDPKRADRRN